MRDTRLARAMAGGALALALVGCSGDGIAPADIGCDGSAAVADMSSPPEGYRLPLARAQLGPGWSVNDAGGLEFVTLGCNVPGSVASVPVGVARGGKLTVNLASSLSVNLLGAQHVAIVAIGHNRRFITDIRLYDSVQPESNVSINVPYGDITSVVFDVQTLRCVTSEQPARVTVSSAWLQRQDASL